MKHVLGGKTQRECNQNGRDVPLMLLTKIKGRRNKEIIISGMDPLLGSANNTLITKVCLRKLLLFLEASDAKNRDACGNRFRLFLLPW